MLDELLAAHADPRIADGQSACCYIRLQPDFILVAIFHQFQVGQCFKAQPVQSVRCIRDQFAQKNLSLGVERMDHQVKKLRGFSLKLKGLTSRHCRHRRSPEESKKVGGCCRGEARPQSEVSILTESMVPCCGVRRRSASAFHYGNSRSWTCECAVATLQLYQAAGLSTEFALSWVKENTGADQILVARQNPTVLPA